MRIFTKKFILLFTFTWFTWLFISTDIAHADIMAFNELIEQLKTEEVIPRGRGRIQSFGSFEDEYPVMSLYQWFPVTNAERFVFSANVSWLSAFQAPTANLAGCGLVFGADPETHNHLMASVRMDGHLYLSGNDFGKALNYIDYFFGYPTISGSVNLTVIETGEKVITYIDGVRLGTRSDMLPFGNALGFSVLSGTNLDFGTKCNWSDVYLYTWE
ncbi:MAG: hypothetical protein IJI41_09125 [Anaerolineaceae bacterium]|nr:hypothetical protein [Anaerolineaceae bacterium]